MCPECLERLLSFFRQKEKAPLQAGQDEIEMGALRESTTAHGMPPYFGAAEVGAPGFRVGQAVIVGNQGQTFPAEIIAKAADGTYSVTYSKDGSSEEVVTSDRIKFDDSIVGTWGVCGAESNVRPPFTISVDEGKLMFEKNLYRVSQYNNNDHPGFFKYCGELMGDAGDFSGEVKLSDGSESDPLVVKIRLKYSPEAGTLTENMWVPGGEENEEIVNFKLGVAEAAAKREWLQRQAREAAAEIAEKKEEAAKQRVDIDEKLKAIFAKAEAAGLTPADFSSNSDSDTDMDDLLSDSDSDRGKNKKA